MKPRRKVGCILSHSRQFTDGACDASCLAAEAVALCPLDLARARATRTPPSAWRRALRCSKQVQILEDCRGVQLG